MIGVHFSSNFAPTLICSDGRDDLAYQSMIESVGAELARGAGEIVARNDGSGREPSHTADRVGSILSEVSWDYEAVLPRPTDQPTVGQGTRYIIRSAARRLTGGGPGAGVF
ncbi:hypothetical protein ACQ86B_29095 (plasmid) [Mycolicibacterium aichiense]|uniref:hypothetical protein n=1 Tax=Mycolicibacterium aichiense TaxID=1799 RepID=UPI003D6718E8